MVQTLFRKMLPAATSLAPHGAVRCPAILINTFRATFEQYACRRSLQSRLFLQFRHPTTGLVIEVFHKSQRAVDPDQSCTRNLLRADAQQPPISCCSFY